MCKLWGMERLPLADQSESCCVGPVQPDAMVPDEATRSLRMFKALADETRYAIFRLIVAQEEPMCACDIVDRFDVSQPTIAHHLKVLRTAGLVTATRRGVWAYYEADPRGVEELHHLTRGFAESSGTLAIR
jgi:ArsR family transcriptional regulator, arsenate/arsenite/antimonite-responsive transcriptional repressor